MQVQKWQCACSSVDISNNVITVNLRQKETEIERDVFSIVLLKMFFIKSNGATYFCDTFMWDRAILPAVICLGTPSGMVQLVCEWVISCPWMKSSVVNERHSLNSPSHRWREETKRNSTITHLRGNKCLSLGSNSFPVQHTEPFTNYPLPTG